jgi:hypothetical protein
MKAPWTPVQLTVAQLELSIACVELARLVGLASYTGRRTETTWRVRTEDLDVLHERLCEALARVPERPRNGAG